MNKEGDPGALLNLLSELDGLKQLRQEYINETTPFRACPQYIRGEYKIMSDKLEQLEKDFHQKYQNLLISMFPELLLFQENIEKQYQKELEKWLYYKQTRLEADGKTITNLGPILKRDFRTQKYFYLSDYDGTQEINRKGKPTPGKNLIGRKYFLPSLAEIFTALLCKFDFYKKMIEEGDEPELRLTPIGLTIKTLGRSIENSKRPLNQVDDDETYYGDYLKEESMIYEPNGFFSRKSWKQKIVGGISKSKFIEKHQGWTIKLISLKKELPVDYDKANEHIRYDFVEEAYPQGYKGLTYEEALSMQMTQFLKNPPEPLDFVTEVIMTESCFVEVALIPVLQWTENGSAFLGFERSLDKSHLHTRRTLPLR